MTDFRKNRGAKAGATIVGSVTLEFDATLRESRQWMATVTDHEVEAGSDITDHVRPKPRSFTLDVVASATPLATSFDNDQRDREFRSSLVAMWEAAELLVVTCEAGVFENCVIASINESIDASSGFAFVASIDLRQISFVERRVVSVPPDPSVNRRVQPELARGTQPTDGTVEAWVVPTAEEVILNARDREAFAQRDQGSLAFRFSTSDAEAREMFGMGDERALAVFGLRP